MQNLDFRFPALHNHRIFECDFFDIEGEEGNADFWKRETKFDWIVGNPPWINLKKGTKARENKFAYKWMNNPQNIIDRPVRNFQLAEAFSWIVTDLLNNDGYIGLILPATSLFNLKVNKYRGPFFSKQEIIKVTNFANLKEAIFGGRATLPPAILIYRPAEKGREKRNIIHYGPFEINQLIEAKDKPWVITVNENEIKTLSPNEAEIGDTLSWKLALWGNQIDKRIIERIKNTFPKTLKGLCEDKKWAFYEGPQLRCNDKKLEYLEMLKGEKQFNTITMLKSPYQFSIPTGVLTPIPEDCCYIRRGKNTGLKLTCAPHIILSSSWMSFIIYSDQDFVIPHGLIGISAPEKNRENVETMKALSVFLSSRLAAYVLFFHAPEWGVFRYARKISVTPVGEIPTPDFTSDQIAKLAHLQEEVTAREKEEISKLVSALKKNRLLAHHIDSNEVIDCTGLPTNLTSAEEETIECEKARIRKELQERIDNNVYEILKIPRDIRQVIEDFFNFRLPLDTPSKKHLAIKKPTVEELENYARELKDKLDDFLMGESFVRVKIIYSDDLIESIIEVANEGGPFPIDPSCVKPGNKTRASLLTELADNLRRQVSQWVYIQRGLRLFDGPRIHIYKTPRIIDWTRTQARIDAADIIGDLVQGNDH